MTDLSAIQETLAQIHQVPDGPVPKDEVELIIRMSGVEYTIRGTLRSLNIQNEYAEMPGFSSTNRTYQRIAKTITLVMNR